MFTGIIEEVGRVRSARDGEIAIAAKKVLWGTNLGDSIAVNGVDLTAKFFDEDGFFANVMPETYRRSNLGDLKAGDPVNLERSLQLAGRAQRRVESVVVVAFEERAIPGRCAVLHRPFAFLIRHGGGLSRRRRYSRRAARAAGRFAV